MALPTKENGYKTEEAFRKVSIGGGSESVRSWCSRTQPWLFTTSIKIIGTQPIHSTGEAIKKARTRKCRTPDKLFSSWWRLAWGRTWPQFPRARGRRKRKPKPGAKNAQPPGPTKKLDVEKNLRWEDAQSRRDGKCTSLRLGMRVMHPSRYAPPSRSTLPASLSENRNAEPRSHRDAVAKEWRKTVFIQRNSNFTSCFYL